MSMTIEVANLQTPIGEITMAVCDGRLCALDFAERWPRRWAKLEKRFGKIELRRANDPAGVVSRLQRYFGGDLDALAPIAMDPGGTPFQRKVWNALLRIPPGSTMSYGELARSIGAPSASRAVGAANGANPIGIVTPCHRVVGADGSLTGYAAGVERKRWLLAHEGARRDA
jgi:methylated-DNA-[protein]-cysteine S-methyltransferase